MLNRVCTISANDRPARLWSLLLVLSALPVAARAQSGSLACEEAAALDPLLARARLLLNSRPGERVAVGGLASLSEEGFWAFVAADAAVPLLLRLQRSQLFAQVEVARDLANGSVRLELVEHPQVSSASVEGASEPAPLLARLLGDVPPTAEPPREPHSALGFLVQRRRMDDGGGAPLCESAPAPAGWFARLENGHLRPGLLRGGLVAARARGLSWLRARGYPYATIKAAITAPGALRFEVDEGRIDSLEVRGVSPAVLPSVERALGLGAGALFGSVELRAAAARLTGRLPFVTLDVRHGAPAHHQTDATGIRSGELDLGDLSLRFGYSSADEAVPGDELRGRVASSAGGAVESLGAGRMVLWLRERRLGLDLQPEQVLRHTPATGFGPGLAATLRVWDFDDRAHLALDAAFAVNLERASRAAPAGATLWERLSAQERFDGLLGARVSIPSWSVAEVGAQVYALTDTNDGWRMGDLNSYVHSALAMAPDRDYFRRTGVTALATLHLLDRLTLGTELRRDRFDPLPSSPVWSLLNRGNPPLPAPEVSAAQLDSLLLRAEWSSDDVPLASVGTLSRHAETSLVRRDGGSPIFATLATLELGERAPGSGSDSASLQLLSDSRLRAPPLGALSLGLRLRVGAGTHVAVQKQEALGGWTALRGYGFKDLRGDASALTSLEARWHLLGAFLDLGTVHQQGWLTPRAGAGLQLLVERLGSLELAWRLDGNGGWRPSARALLAQSF